MPKYAEVYILDAVYKIDKRYGYALPEHLQVRAAPGKFAVVPFGNGNTARNAVIVSVSDTAEYAHAKPMFDISETDFAIDPELLALCGYMKEMYFCTFGEAVRTVMPAGISLRISEYYVLREGLTPDASLYGSLNAYAADLFSYVARNGPVSAAQLKEAFGKDAAVCASRLVRLGYLEKRADASCRENSKTNKYLQLLLPADTVYQMVTEKTRRFTPKQLYALRVLADCGGKGTVRELAELCGCGESVIRELKKKDAVEIVEVKNFRSPYRFDETPESPDFTLSDEQAQALDVLSSLSREGVPRAALLYGVTGSGKTNVILKLIDFVLSQNKTVIYLVPEIALTGQNIAIFSGRYGARVAVLHSALSAGERLDAWQKIRAGGADIVIGTRSAVFAPLRRLGLIVIDEEQESSFKSEMSPKYHAVDIARFRCAKNGALMLLASATPSVESFCRASENRYTLVCLTRRYGAAKLPDVIIHDMKPEPSYLSENGDLVPSMIGKVLDEELKKNLASGEQSILFINRRGYHAFLTCRSCGNPVVCPNCSVSLTYHHNPRLSRENGKLVCHYCGYTSGVLSVCPHCGGNHMTFIGSGTQMLEENLSRAYPAARILRMDTDTTSGKLAHDEILGKFRAGEADILIGTQMVTKGHDFPNVTLAGVILADTSLYLNDFRANERTFSLLTQVLGRAGRGEKPGRAVIQTYSPDNTTLHLAARQDYRHFYAEEIRLRRAALFPPFCDLVTFLFSSELEEQAKNAAASFGRAADLSLKGEFRGLRMIFFGPFEAPIYKLNGKYRIRYLIKCRYDKTTRAFFQKLFSEFSALDGVSLSADINPLSL